jgi:hypothetical protein
MTLFTNQTATAQQKYMYRILTTAFLLLICLSRLSAQIRYEKGYFIDTTSKRTDCLIRNVEWKNNPRSIQYKMTEGDTPKESVLPELSEFGIDGQSRYLRAKVKIDRSSEHLDNLSKFRNPEFTEESLFLKVLIDGKASLFTYTDSKVTRFFYRVDSSGIEQLVYKKFMKETREVGENVTFRQQLWTRVNCSKLPLASFSSVRYMEDELEAQFSKYNACAGGGMQAYKVKRDFFHLWVLPGINYSTFSLSNSQVPSYDFTLDNQFGWRFGLMGEFVLPIQKNKWSIILEGSYQYMNKEKNGNYVKYKAIEFPIGIRHRFFLTDNTRIFLNVQLVSFIGYDFKSTIKAKGASEIEVKSGNNFAFGAGLEYKRINAEIRYSYNRPLLDNYWSYDSNYQRVSFIFGFKLF